LVIAVLRARGRRIDGHANARFRQNPPLRRFTALRDSGRFAISRRSPFAGSGSTDRIAFPTPAPQLAEGALLIEGGRLRSNLTANPIRKANLFDDVLSGGSVHFMNLRKVCAWKSVGQAHQSGP